MKYEVEIDGSRRTVEIKSFTGGRLTATVDGRELDCEVTQPQSGSYLFISEHKHVYEIQIEQKNDGSGNVEIAGARLTTRVIDPKHRSRTADHGASGRQQILSPMPGKVVRLMVAAGDEVKLGQGVVVIEAMKMQNELKSPKDGIVSQVAVQEGQTVTASQALITID